MFIGWTQKEKKPPQKTPNNKKKSPTRWPAPYVLLHLDSSARFIANDWVGPRLAFDKLSRLDAGRPNVWRSAACPVSESAGSRPLGRRPRRCLTTSGRSVFCPADRIASRRLCHLSRGWRVWSPRRSRALPRVVSEDGVEAIQPWTRNPEWACQPASLLARGALDCCCDQKACKMFGFSSSHPGLFAEWIAIFGGGGAASGRFGRTAREDSREAEDATEQKRAVPVLKRQSSRRSARWRKGNERRHVDAFRASEVARARSWLRGS